MSQSNSTPSDDLSVPAASSSKRGLTEPRAILIAAIVTVLGLWASEWLKSYLAKDAGGLPGNPAVSQQSLPAASAPGFGQWLALDKNVAYEAKSDGFVTAVSVGSKPSTGVEIYSGPVPSPDKMPLRARGASAYDGVSLPVRKGEYWYVKNWNGDGEIKVYWLPIGN